MTVTPELSALQDVCASLDRVNIDYMLTGSLAMSFYARPRMTRDVDLVVALDSSAVELLPDALGADYHIDADALREAALRGRPWNVLHLPSLVKIDLIPLKDTEYRCTEFKRRRKVQLAGVSLWIVSIEDLILSKLEWARDSHSEQQRRDVRLLLDAPLDRDYLNQWAGRLSLTDALKEAEHE